jgi:chemotaxis methyl-accepting protein methylase
MLLLELAGGAGRRVADGAVDATDLDRTVLARGEAGAYPRKALSDLPAQLVARYFTGTDPLTIAPALRRLVRFLPHDLTREAAPAGRYDLIMCRNVVIYFDRPLQERLFRMFAEALPPQGILVLGKVETLVGGARSAFQLVDTRERVYRRV